MTPPRLRAGLVGLGKMGRYHAGILKHLAGVRLVAAVDPAGDPEGVLTGIPVLDNVEQLLLYGIDYAVVACPTLLHEQVGLQLAAAGIPALIEKPLAATAAAAKRLVDAFAAAALPAAVGHVERFNPALQVLRSCLTKNELGRVYQIATRRQGPRPHRITDVGVLKDLAVHDLDTTSWLIGQPYAVLHGESLRRIESQPPEDLVALTGKLADGTVTNHLTNWLSPSRERVTTVIGEAGCLMADTLNTQLTLHRHTGLITDRVLPGHNPLTAEHVAFLQLLQHENRNNLATLDDGYRALVLLETAENAANTARVFLRRSC